MTDDGAQEKKAYAEWGSDEQRIWYLQARRKARKARAQEPDPEPPEEPEGEP